MYDEIERLSELHIAYGAHGGDGVEGRYVRVGHLVVVVVGGATVGFAIADVLQVRADVRRELNVVGEHQIAHVALFKFVVVDD